MKKTTRKAAQAATRLGPVLFVRLFASRRSRCSPAAIQGPGFSRRTFGVASVAVVAMTIREYARPPFSSRFSGHNLAVHNILCLPVNSG